MSTMTKERIEELLINAFEGAINDSTRATIDLINVTGITSEELEELGYEKENFPDLHEMAEGTYEEVGY